MDIEIKKALDELKGVTETFTSEFQGIKGNLAKLDGLDKTKFDAFVADMEAKSKKIDDDLAATKEAHRKLEAAVSRPGAGVDGTKAEEQAELVKMDAFLRKGEGFGKSINIIEKKAMATDVQADGGFLVLPELSSTIITRIFETSPIRGIANVEQTGSKSRTFLIDDDTDAAEWTGERAAATEVSEQLGEKEISVHNVRRLIRATADVLADAYIDLAAWIGAKGADSIARAENSAFVTGNGVAKPRGFLTYPNWASAGVYERDKVEQVSAGASSLPTADRLIATQGSLKEGYQAGASWGMKRATYFSVLALRGADQFFFGPTLLRDGQMQWQLLGKPVTFMDDMEAVGANARAFVYGDFRRFYTILDRVGLQILRDPYTAHPYTLFHMTRRTGGDVTNFEAAKIGITTS
jgi:HK97 family phage major capsid protein